jgi:rhodanese-related sulfurtransferase
VAFYFTNKTPMKKLSTKSKAIVFSLAFVLVVSSFYWIIINFSMKQAGLEHLKIIETKEAYELINQNKDNPDFKILDMRTHLEYYDDHIQNAILVSYTDNDFKEQLMRLDTATSYLVYCWKGSKNKHIRAMMKEAGFSQAWYIDDGYEDWIEMGYPVEKVVR